MTNHKFIRENLYALKRQYGLSLEIYSIQSSDVNLKTGEKEVVKKVYRIAKAILLPVDQFRKIVKLLNATEFRYGGSTDKDSRTVIVDARDYPKGYETKVGDYFIVQHKRYNFEKTTFFDSGLALLIEGTLTEGELPAAIIQQNVISTLDLNSGGGSTLE